LSRLSFSTLFPYTTLFRSPFGFRHSDLIRHSSFGFRHSCEFVFVCVHSWLEITYGKAHWFRKTGRRREEEHHRDFAARCRCETKDRKSTRLNSSHLGISYA